MKSVTFWILCLSLSPGRTNFIYGQGSEQHFADELYISGQYLDAALEYQRELFFSDNLKGEKMLRIAECYLALDKADQAANFYNLAYINAENDSVRAEAIIGTGLLNILSENYVSTIAEQYNMPEGANIRQKHFGALLEAIAYIQTDDYGSAREALIRSGDSLKAKETIRTIQHLHKKYNPKRAFYMSLLVPGLGQLQAGKPKAAINSLALVGTLFYLTSRIAISYGFVDAIATMYPWLYRYYLGGATKAEEINNDKIAERKRSAYLDEIGRFEEK